jgi:hypothetical protein
LRGSAPGLDRPCDFIENRGPASIIPQTKGYWWRIVRIKGTPAPTIGYVEAADAETAIKKAIKEFKRMPKYNSTSFDKAKRTERPTGLAQHRNVRWFFGSWRPVDPNSRRAFEASPDRCGHCGNKSIVHPIKLALCVG